MSAEAEAVIAARRFETLRTELAPASPRAWRYAALAVLSRAGACLSGGPRFGHRQGF
jgi:hypothetical protein